MKATEAGDKCKVRGYIVKQSNPKEKLWKNTVGFYACLPDLPGDDWAHHDPEGDETSTVG